jgi:hypothetical protein
MIKGLFHRPAEPTVFADVVQIIAHGRILICSQRCKSGQRRPRKNVAKGLCPWMRLAIGFPQGLDAQMGVNLRGVEAGVAEEFLHGADVGARR